jgi:hypothetical protein
MSRKVDGWNMDVYEVSVGVYRVTLTKNSATIEFYTRDEDSFTELAQCEISKVA